MSLEALDAPMPRLSHHDQALDLLRNSSAPLSMTGLVQRLGIGRRAGAAVLRDLIDRQAIRPVTIADRTDVVWLAGEPTPDEIERVATALSALYEPPPARRKDRRQRVTPRVREDEFCALLELRATTPIDLREAMGVSTSVVSTTLRSLAADGRVVCLGKLMHAKASSASGLYIGRSLFDKTLKELNS
ncbi:hypothetical protein [Nevskia sp.]|uniref:hypothetical protein n=1 Tax=Nevskia sp. TaxID=1929292 RepID=UPI0025E6E974|nr:hypothetical protein [Nevskia sp.]